MTDHTPTSDATFNEADHPRGNPENAGQFTKKGTGKHLYEFIVGGVNSKHETAFIRANSYQEASNLALMRACNGNDKFKSRGWAKPISFNGHNIAGRYGIIDGARFRTDQTLKKTDEDLKRLFPKTDDEQGEGGKPASQVGAQPVLRPGDNKGSGTLSNGSQGLRNTVLGQSNGGRGGSNGDGSRVPSANAGGSAQPGGVSKDPSQAGQLPVRLDSSTSTPQIPHGTVYQPTLGLASDTSHKPHYAEDSKYQPKKHYFRELIRSLKGIAGEKNPSDIPAHRAEMKPTLGVYTRARVSERMPKDPNLAGASMSPKEVREMVKKSCDLIKTVPHGKKLKGVETRVKRLFENTNTTKDTLKRYLMGKCGLKEYQANRIIEDQSLKYKANAHLEELKRQGVKTVRWCVGDCKEHRPSHLAPWPYGLNGCVFPIGEPPTDPATGRKVYPGDEIQCHCYLEAVE